MRNSQIMVDHSHRDPQSWHGFLRADSVVVKLCRKARYSWPLVFRRWAYHRHEFEPPQDNTTPPEVDGLPYWLTQAMNAPRTTSSPAGQARPKSVSNVVVLNDFRK